MGSGLILLFVVGAWLAVLVPMALRSHDASTSLSSVDRFNDAMRVLSRREQTGRGSVRAFVQPVAPAEPKPGVPLAVRRRRVLLILVGLSAVGLVVGLLGSDWGYGLFVVLAGLAAAYVVHLRKAAVRRQEQARAARRRDGSAWGAAVYGSAWAEAPPRVAGIPDRMPSRPLPLTAALPAPAARYEDPHPVAATWDAPEFPVPTYVNAPLAPPRPPRVLDLTRPGEWSSALEAEDVGLVILTEDDDELDDILERRRASGDW